MKEGSLRPYLRHSRSSADLVTTYEATRAGFVALALERNRQATPYVEEARVLQAAASQARTPAELPGIKGIEAGLLTAAGLSDKALAHLQAEDKTAQVRWLHWRAGCARYEVKNDLLGRVRLIRSVFNNSW